MAGPHNSLLTLLRCLDRDDVSSLHLTSGEVVTATRAQGEVALTQVPLTVTQVEALLHDTDIGTALAQAGHKETFIDTLVAERALRVALCRRPDWVQVHIARRPQSAAAAPPPIAPPAQMPAPRHETVPAAPAPVKASGRRDGIELAPRAPSPPAAPAAAPAAVPFAPAPIPSVALRPPDAPHPQAAPHIVPQSVAANTSAPSIGHADALMALGSMVAQARLRGASDLHLVGDAPLRLRSGGKLSAHGEAVDAAGLLELGMALLSARQKQSLSDRGYVDLAMDLPQAGRVRANISRHPLGLKLCLRLVPAQVPTLAELALPQDLAAVTAYHQGLAIVSGPGGHGKSSTLAALVGLLNSDHAHHIITVEDPIEVIHPVRKSVISQREVGQHTASFARALKAALRQDPDIIVIGELRDRETVEIALSAAETGHLVLATMNTRSAAKTIDRLIDLFPPDDQAQVRATLAGSLKMVISQRLIPSLEGGMVPAIELLTGGVPLWSLIRDNKLLQLPSLQQRGRSAGMIRLDTSLLALVRAKTVAADVARGYAENPAEFDRQLAGAAEAGPGNKEV